MAFISTIPQETDQISNSQSQLLNNNAALATTLLGVNTAGLLCSDQSSDPLTGANQIALYSRVAKNPVLGTDVLTLRNNTNGSIVEFSGGVNASPGWSRLPSGALLKWQTVTILASTGTSSSTPFTWQTGTTFPAFSNPPWSVMLQGITTTNWIATMGVNSLTATTMNINAYAPAGFLAGTVYVFAIGPG